MKKLTIILFVFCTFWSCTDKKTQLINEIEQLEDAMSKENFPSKENMERVIALCDEYATIFPNDIKTYGFMELKAKYQNANEQYLDAVKTYRTIINKYPNNPRTPENMFMLAFIQDNNLGNKKKAEELYRKIIKDYPKHELADDAQFSLDNLYLSDEEILKMLNEKNKP